MNSDHFAKLRNLRENKFGQHFVTLKKKYLECLEKGLNLIVTPEELVRAVEECPWINFEDLCLRLCTDSVTLELFLKSLGFNVNRDNRGRTLILPHSFEPSRLNKLQTRCAFSFQLVDVLKLFKVFFYGKLKGENIEVRLIWGAQPEMRSSESECKTWLSVFVWSRGGGTSKEKCFNSWLSDAVADIEENDHRFVVFARSSNFTEDAIRFQSKLKPIVKCDDEMNPLTDEMKSGIVKSFNGALSIGDVKTKIMVHFDNSRLKSIMRDYLRKIEKNVATNGFVF